MNNIVAGLLGLLLVVVPVFAAAQEGSSPIAGYCPTLTASFGRGSSDATTGGQVTQLQRFLADYYDLNTADYVTGYFGRLTQMNVMRFQADRSISPASGFVGPLTRAAISGACSTATWDLPSSTYAQATYYSQSAYTPAYSQATYYSQGSYSTSASCSFNGQTVVHGQSVTAYQESSVTAGSSCASQSRACSNGTLGGSYTYASCSVQAASATYPDNANILVWDGGIVSGYRRLWLEHSIELIGVKLFVDGEQVTNVDLQNGGKCSTMAASKTKNSTYVCVPSSIVLSPGTHALEVWFASRVAYPTPLYAKIITITAQ